MRFMTWQALSVRPYPEAVTAELQRLRRWLPAFADGERAAWGDVADCLAAAADALPAAAVVGPARYCYCSPRHGMPSNSSTEGSICCE